jgi:hypothetical protein
LQSGFDSLRGTSAIAIINDKEVEISTDGHLGKAEKARGTTGSSLPFLRLYK